MHLRTLSGVVAGLGAAGLAYSAGYEVRAFTLRRVDVPVLPPGSRPLTVLHISDLHMTPRQGKKERWIRALAGLQPDLVVNTGDSLGHPDAVQTVVEALEPLLDRPGVFVFGSNDYFAPIVKNPVRYLLPEGQDKTRLGTPMPWRDLRDEFGERGWTDLTNRRDQVKVGGLTLAFAGVDDPHLGYDDLDAIQREADPDADLRIGVAHAPYLRVLDAFTRDGYELTFAGHTHGGQLRLPVVGALVTNCDLDTGRARGLHSHRVGDRSAWLHVSAGLGTSMFAPVRFCCRPEATLLTLLPRLRPH
ncbi:MAG: metallophosphoesterase [Propionibacteriales bacterium]|nr:metallophosphoesterase [Propionibacteriales bacterium]